MEKINIIATVGTSILTNIKNDDIKIYNEKINNLKNEEEYKKLAEIYYREKIKNISGNESAELQTLLKIFDKYKYIKEFNIYLISSDTNDSYFCSFVDAILLNKLKNNINVKNIRLQGLCVDDYNKFRNNGINNFLKIIKELKEKDKNNFILCISGGFKGFIPIMTIVGQLYDMKSYYIFEKSNVLIEIPVLPFNFDYEELYDIYTTPDEQTKNERLIKYGFIDSANGETVIGILAKKIYEEKTPYLIDLWGKIVEFLLFEYFYTYSYKDINNNIASKIEKNKILNGVEFDLVFYCKKNEILSVCEIKPLRKIYNEFEELKAQIKKQIEVVKQKKIKEYCIIFYSLQGDNINKKRIEQISKLFQENNICFRVFYTNLKEKLKNINLNKEYLLNQKNKFKLLLDSKFTPKDIIEI